MALARSRRLGIANLLGRADHKKAAIFAQAAGAGQSQMVVPGAFVPCSTLHHAISKLFDIGLAG
jgi:hypothetical protein